MYACCYKDSTHLTRMQAQEPGAVRQLLCYSAAVLQSDSASATAGNP